MLRLTATSGDDAAGEVFTETAHRPVGQGCPEAQAYTLAKVIGASHVALDRNATDATCKAAVIDALVEAKTAAQCFVRNVLC